MKLHFRLFGILAVMMAAACPLALADTSGPFTLSFSNLTTGADALQRTYSTFSLPKFDAALGSLQSIDLAYNVSGSVIGTATGVSQSSSFNSTIDHWVFFEFTDIANNVFMAEPSLRLTASIPAAATVSFGPALRSSSGSFRVAPGDLRFDAWRGGPGTISGQLGVYFSNTTMGFTGLQFFPGTDSGVYGGSFSVAYNYVPVPEPKSLLLTTVASLLFFCVRRQRRPAA